MLSGANPQDTKRSIAVFGLIFILILALGRNSLQKGILWDRMSIIQNGGGIDWLAAHFSNNGMFKH